MEIANLPTKIKKGMDSAQATKKIFNKITQNTYDKYKYQSQITFSPQYVNYLPKNPIISQVGSSHTKRKLTNTPFNPGINDKESFQFLSTL